MEEMEKVQFDVFMTENKIEFDGLPEELQSQIQKFDDLNEQLEEEEDENKRADFIEKMKAMDAGLLGKLKQYVADKVAQSEKAKAATQAQAAAATQAGGASASQQNQSKDDDDDDDKPFFWLG